MSQLLDKKATSYPGRGNNNYMEKVKISKKNINHSGSQNKLGKWGMERRPLPEEIMLSAIESWVNLIKNNLDKLNIKGTKRRVYVSPFHPKYLRYLGKLSTVCGISEQDLRAKYKLALQYRDKLIERNQKLIKYWVDKFSEKYKCQHINDILYNMGLEGLTKAIESYQTKYKTSLTTYAYMKIKNEVRRGYLREAFVVDLPVSISKEKRDIETVKRNINRIQKQVYLSEQIFEDDSSSDLFGTKMMSIFAEFGNSETFSEPETLILQMEKQEIIHKIIKKLSREEQELIDCLFGFTRTPISISKYCEIKKITPMTVYRRKKTIFRKMLEMLKQEGIDVETLI